MQIKLLRVLQEKELVRVGGLKPVPVRARVITATNKNLAQEVESGNFRSDLYYRLQLISLKIPPLRERKEDIPELVEFFIHKSNMDLGKKIRGIEKSAMDKLLAYDWPGNVRELENVIKRATILTRGQTLGIHRLDSFKPEDTKSNGSHAEALVERTVKKWFKQKDSSTFFGPGQIYRNIIVSVEKTLIKEALEFCKNNQVKASELLGMNRATLRKKMAEYELK